jgi:hypothetical protein
VPDTYTFTAVVWEHEGPGAWHFLSLPAEVADEIADSTAGRARGFGSVRVAVRIGRTSWSTSVFPDRRRGTYVLPVKRAVRSAQGLADGTACEVRLEVVDQG